MISGNAQSPLRWFAHALLVKMAQSAHPTRLRRIDVLFFMVSLPLLRNLDLADLKMGYGIE